MADKPDTVGEFVLLRMSNMLLRPRMYTGSPEEFEAVLSILDEIYVAYGSPKPADTRYNTFVDYLQEHGYNANTYCSFQRMKNPHITNDKLWLGLTGAWNEYLSGLIDHGESVKSDQDDSVRQHRPKECSE